jgi:DNA mismatch repair ATPase MutL
MKTKIVRGAMLLLLSLIISRTSFGQTYTWEHQFLHIDDDSSRNPPQTTIVYKNGPLYTVRMEGDKILDFNVDGRQIPPDSLSRYKEVIGTLKEEVRKARVQAKLDREQAVRDREQAEKDREQAGRDREQADRDREQAEKDRAQSIKDREQADRDREQAVNDQKQAERDQQQSQLERLQAERDRQQAEKDREQAGRDREQAERDRQQAVLDRKRAEEDRAILRSLIQDAVKDGLVPDEDSVFSVKLNEDEFILNGKKPSEAIQKKYIAKYAKPGNSVSFHRGCCSF